MNINFKLHSLKTNGLTNIVLFALLFSFYTGNAQTQFWSDNFEGSPSSGIRIPEENGGVGGPPMTSYFRLTDDSTVAQVVPFTGKEDTLIIGPGASIVNDGTLANNGTINYQGGVGTFNNPGTYSGTGSFLGVLVNTGNVSPGN